MAGAVAADVALFVSLFAFLLLKLIVASDLLYNIVC